MSHVESWSLYKNSPRGAHFTSRDAPVIAPEAAEVGTLATNGTERQRASIRSHPINLREHTLNELREWSIGQRSSRPYVTRHADSCMHPSLPASLSVSDTTTTTAAPRQPLRIAILNAPDEPLPSVVTTAHPPPLISRRALPARITAACAPELAPSVFDVRRCQPRSSPHMSG